jgi:PAS domain S-box-containing protein
VQDINKRAMQMLGMSKKHKLGLDLMCVSSERKKLTEAILSEEKEKRVKMDGNETIVYHIIKESAKSLKGSRLVVIRDITETFNYQNKIKAEEQKYREMYSFFRLLSDNMPDMLWAKDLDLRFTYANKSLVEEVLLAKTSEETMGKMVRDFPVQTCDESGNQIANQTFWSQSDWSDNMVLKNSQAYMSDEHVCINGIVKELDVRKAPIFDEQGNMVGIVGSARDVTHQRQIEQELVNARNKAEESDRLKSAFLANMSHEIRTPMNTILGFVSLLQESDLDEKEQAEYLQIVRDSSERLLSTLSDIIDLSKVEAGFTTPTYSDFDVQDLFMNLYIMQKKSADEKQLLLIRQWNLPSDLIFIHSDKEKVFSIASNLVNNAIKYTNQGYVEFRCQVTRDRLELFVKDTGIGIPEDKLQSIFERFIQVDVSHQRLYEGAGLGLSITKAYVDMLGGTIDVESELGKGSLFHVSLPISIADVFLHDA